MTNRSPESELLVGAASSVWLGGTSQITIRIKAGEKLYSTMKNEFGLPVEEIFITDSDIRHIKRRHWAEKNDRSQIPITPKDFADLPAILNEFDTCELTDIDKLGNKKFLLTKNIEGVVYVATIQRGKKKLEVKTMWKRKPGASC